MYFLPWKKYMISDATPNKIRRFSSAQLTYLHLLFFALLTMLHEVTKTEIQGMAENGNKAQAGTSYISKVHSWKSF